MLIDMRLSLPRDARYVSLMRNLAACVLTDLKAPDEARHDLQLAITEACANAVKHANGGNEYSVRFAIDPDGCLVEIIDAGPGFDSAKTDARWPVDDELETGRGLMLIDALVDDFEFIHEREGTTLRLLKRWPELRLPEPTSTSTSS